MGDTRRDQQTGHAPTTGTPAAPPRFYGVGWTAGVTAPTPRAPAGGGWLPHGTVIYGNVMPGSPGRPTSQTAWRLVIGPHDTAGTPSSAARMLDHSQTIQLADLHFTDDAAVQVFALPAAADFGAPEEAYWALYHSPTTRWNNFAVPTRRADAWAPAVALDASSAAVPVGSKIYARAMPAHVNGVDVFGRIWKLTVAAHGLSLAKVLFDRRSGHPVADLQGFPDPDHNCEWRDPPADGPQLPGFVAVTGAGQRGYAVFFTPAELGMSAVVEALADQPAGAPSLWVPGEADRTRHAIVARALTSQFHLQYGHRDSPDDYLPVEPGVLGVFNAVVALAHAVSAADAMRTSLTGVPSAQVVLDYFDPALWRDEYGDHILDGEGRTLTCELLQLQHSDHGAEGTYVDLAAANTTVQHANAALRPYLTGVSREAAGLKHAVDDAGFVSSLSAFIARGPGQAAWACTLLCEVTNLLSLHDNSPGDFGPRLAAELVGNSIPVPADGTVDFSPARFAPLVQALAAAPAAFHALDAGLLADAPATSGGTGADGATGARPQGAAAPGTHAAPTDAGSEAREQVETFGSFSEHATSFIGIVNTAAGGIVRLNRAAAHSVTEEGAVRRFLERALGTRANEVLRQEVRRGAEALAESWRHTHHAGNETLAQFLHRTHATGAFTAISLNERCEHLAERAHQWGESMEHAVSGSLEAFSHACEAFNAVSLTCALGLEIFNMSSGDERVAEAQHDWLNVMSAVADHYQTAFAHAAEEAGEHTAEARAASRLARVAGGANALISCASAYVDYNSAMHHLGETGWNSETYQGFVGVVGDILSIAGDALTLMGAPEVGLVLTGLGTVIGFVGGWIGEQLEERRRERWGEDALGAEAYKRRLVMATRYVNEEHAIYWFDDVRILDDAEHKLRIEAKLPFPLDHDHFETRPLYAMVRYAGYYATATEGNDPDGRRRPWAPLRIAPNPSRYFEYDGYWIDALRSLEPKPGEPGTYWAHADDSQAFIDYELGWTQAELHPGMRTVQHPDWDPEGDYVRDLPAITLRTGFDSSGNPILVPRPGVAIPIVAQVFTTGRYFGAELLSLESVRDQLLDRQRSIGNFPNAGLSPVRAFVPLPHDQLRQSVVGRQVYVYDTTETDWMRDAGVADGVSKLPPAPAPRPRRHHDSPTPPAAPGPVGSGEDVLAD